MDFKVQETKVDEQLAVATEKNSIYSLSDFELALIGGGSGDVIFA